MPLPLLTTDSRQGPIQTRHRARSKGKYRLAAHRLSPLVHAALRLCCRIDVHARRSHVGGSIRK